MKELADCDFTMNFSAAFVPVTAQEISIGLNTITRNQSELDAFEHCSEYNTSGNTSDVLELMASLPNVTGRNERLAPEVVHQIILMSFFAVFALIGNIGLLVYLIQIQAWTRPVSIFVMALALTDVLIATFSMSTEILWEAFNEWIFGYAACKLATYTQCALFINTAFILMGMSYDRYQAICCPMLFSRTLSRGRKMIIGSWLMGFLLAIPQLFIFVQVQVGDHADGTPVYACKSNGYTAIWQRRIYVTWIAACVFIIPLCFVAYCYINIARVVWKSISQRSALAQGNEMLSLRMKSPAQRRTSDRAKMRTIKLTICILSCYILCWTPYFTLNLLNVWTDYKYKNHIPSIVKTIAKSLAWFSSCVNPLIYGGFLMPDKTLRNCCRKRTFHRPQADLAYCTGYEGSSYGGESHSASPAIALMESTRSYRPGSTHTLKDFVALEGKRHDRNLFV